MLYATKLFLNRAFVDNNPHSYNPTLTHPGRIQCVFFLVLDFKTHQNML